MQYSQYRACHTLGHTLASARELGLSSDSLSQQQSSQHLDRGPPHLPAHWPHVQPQEPQDAPAPAPLLLRRFDFLLKR
jgi:hypothetical protein